MNNAKKPERCKLLAIYERLYNPACRFGGLSVGRIQVSEQAGREQSSDDGGALALGRVCK